MKKILYSLMAIAGLMTTSCISFDDPVAENYGVGPAATIAVSEVSDSAFTFTVNPGENALYYSILVDQSADTVAVDAANLLSGAYSSVFNVVVNTEKAKTFTYNMRNAAGAPICMPGKTYQIYAVAATDKGVVGEVAVKTVSTTDQLAPRPVDYMYDDAEKAMLVAFSEPVKLGEGAFKVVSYKYQDLISGKTAGEQIEVSQVLIDEDIIAIYAETAPGAYVAFSWEAGALVDAAGHGCTALNSGFSLAQGDFVGLVGQNETVGFEVTAENVESPVLGSTIEDAAEFFGTLSFDFDVFVPKNPGLVKVTYSNAQTSTTYNLTYGENWDVDGQSFMFILPAEPQAGDVISLSLEAGVITDAYGNPNAAVDFNEAWTMSMGVPVTDATFTGVFATEGVSEYDGTAYSLGDNVVLTRLPEYDTEFDIPEGGCCVAVSDFILEGAVIPAYYDLAKGKLYIGAFYAVGEVEMKDGTVYGSITYSKSGKDWIEFSITKDGKLVSDDLQWVATNLEYTQAVGYLDKFSTTTFTKIADADAASAPAKVKKNFAPKSVNVKSAKNLSRLVK